MATLSLFAYDARDGVCAHCIRQHYHCVSVNLRLRQLKQAYCGITLCFKNVPPLACN